jgi:hypothetical protein
MSDEIKVSRRWFLIGGSAAGAAVAIPALPRLETPPRISLASLQDLFPYREIVDLVFVPDTSSESPSSFVNLIRPDGECIFRSGVGRGSMLRWVSIPGDEIIVTRETAFRVEVTPSPIGAEISMVFNVQPDRKKMRRFFSETFGWSKDGVLVAPPPIPLDIRDDGLTPADLLNDDPPRPPLTLAEEDDDEDCDLDV